MTVTLNDKPIEATHFHWDGCHKIYLVGSQADRDGMNDAGWEDSELLPITKLPQAWASSCPLRFISWGDLSRPDLVPQFAEEDGPVTIESKES